MILSSCSSVGNGDTDLTVTKEVTDIPADSTTIISEVDPMSDADLETTDESSGAFFDSFTSSDGGNKWTAEKTSSVNYSDGAMTISTDYYDNDSSVNRNLFKALEDNFKVEFRLKVSSEGRRVGFVCGMGGRRIFAYIFPDAMLIQTTNGALDEIVLPIYNEWHTYCFIAENGVVHFYFDGGYVVSFNPQISPSSKITFFAACVTSHATVYSVDYISYTPFSSEPVALLDINDGVLSDVNSFTLTARVGADVRDEGEEVSYYANGVRIGSSAKKGVAYSYDWEDIPQGTYIIHAEYGKYKSAPVTVTFGEQEQSEIKVREAEYEAALADAE